MATMTATIQKSFSTRPQNRFQKTNRTSVQPHTERVQYGTLSYTDKEKTLKCKTMDNVREVAELIQKERGYNSIYLKHLNKYSSTDLFTIEELNNMVEEILSVSC